MTKKLRVSVLLLIFVVIAIDQSLKHLQTTDWDYPLWVVIYPINADGKDSTQQYINNLNNNSFKAVDKFFARQSKLYMLSLKQPVETQLAEQIYDHPPLLKTGAPWYNRLLWSLRVRYWASKNDSYNDASPDIRIYVMYYDPEFTQNVPHSIGLQKGKLGIVYAFAASKQAEQNAFVISHELLHTVGASDKYILDSGLPIHPEGYAEPNRDPLYPQDMAEIMGGRIPINAQEAIIPSSLEKVIIGSRTAQEINWLD